ncbi:phage protein NinX family protein [Atlantibacter hermannii]|uniref:phage protein NinX family protein n=1 Tax=Atlantibacter hermannii TaxID=565 RepID=UPI0032436EEE
MTDYSKLSDFEINCEVLAVFNPDIKHMSLSGDNSCFYDCGPTGDGWNQIDIPDYCNNPADAWPIIASKKICIAFDVFAEPDDGGGWVASPAYYIEGERIRHDNPLRAAMIVYLMMQDASHANS